MPPHSNPFYSKVMTGIEEACRRSGINLLFVTLPVDENNRPLETPPMLENYAADGLLLVGAFVDSIITAIGKRRLPPLVLVDGYSDTDSYDAVISDNFQGAYDAAAHLIHMGHREIGLLGGEANAYPSLQERCSGFRRALKDNGLSNGHWASFNVNRGKGYEQVTQLLQENSQITALFAVNDDVAVTALRAASDLGKKVPEDLSLVSYDDTYLVANANPPLSSMHVDTLSMGREAVHLLQLRLENPEATRMTLTIHPTLVERGSVSAGPQYSNRLNP